MSACSVFSAAVCMRSNITIALSGIGMIAGLIFAAGNTETSNKFLILTSIFGITTASAWFQRSIEKQVNRLDSENDELRETREELDQENDELRETRDHLEDQVNVLSEQVKTAKDIIQKLASFEVHAKNIGESLDATDKSLSHHVEELARLVQKLAAAPR